MVSVTSTPGIPGSPAILDAVAVDVVPHEVADGGRLDVVAEVGGQVVRRRRTDGGRVRVDLAVVVDAWACPANASSRPARRSRRSRRPRSRHRPPAPLSPWQVAEQVAAAGAVVVRAHLRLAADRPCRCRSGRSTGPTSRRRCQARRRRASVSSPSGSLTPSRCVQPDQVADAARPTVGRPVAEVLDQVDRRRRGVSADASTVPVGVPPSGSTVFARPAPAGWSCPPGPCRLPLRCRPPKQ